jgi:hypothetical protein
MCRFALRLRRVEAVLAEPIARPASVLRARAVVVVARCYNPEHGNIINGLHPGHILRSRKQSLVKS